MDLLTLMQKGLVSKESVTKISKEADASADQVATVLVAAIPTMLSKMQENAKDEKGAKQLTKAVKTHSKKDTSDISSFLSGVDMEDGAKILSHIFGSSSAASTQETKLAKSTGLKKSQVATILCMAAPLLLSILGKETDQEEEEEEKLTAKEKKEKEKKEKEKEASGDITSLLGSLLLGGLTGSSSSSSGLDIGSLISFATKDSDGDGKSDIGSTLSSLLGGRKLF